MDEFEHLVSQLMSPDNTARRSAEEMFNTFVKTIPDNLTGNLIGLAKSSGNPMVRGLAFILLRRTLAKKDKDIVIEGKNGKPTHPTFWDKLSSHTKSALKTEFLVCLQDESERSVRKKLVDTISDLCLFLSQARGIQEEWPELLPSLFTLTKSSEEPHRISALDVFGNLCSYLGASLKPYYTPLKGVFTAGLTDSSIRVRLAGLTASLCFIQLLENEEMPAFQDLTPLMIDVLGASLKAGLDYEAQQAMQVFVEFADVEPDFLRPHFGAITESMLGLADSTADDAIRQLALEFLITLAESRPALVRKIPTYTNTLVPIIIKFIMDVEDYPEWNETLDDDDDLDVTNNLVGEECMDRLALTLRGKTVAPIVFNLAPTLLSNSDWRHRYAGIIAICLIGEGCHKFLEPNLEPIIKMILPHFRDPHHRVRWAACNAVGQMSTDFGPMLQKNFHGDVMPALIHIMASDTANPRVQSHAASAIINFSESCKKETMKIYLEALLRQLAALIEGGKRIVQEQAITAIAAIADCAQDDFTPYYDVFIPRLKEIISGAVGKEYRKLRGKAFECLSLLAVSVGKEKSRADAIEVMGVLMHTLKEIANDPTDPQAAFLLPACERVAKVLGEEFEPYLPYVMPSLIKSASSDPEVCFVEADEEQNEGWSYVPLGDKNLAINTTAIEEKLTACSMIQQYAHDLRDIFFPYVEEVSNIMIPLLDFQLHDGIRATAFSCMSAVIKSLTLYLQKHNSWEDPTPVVGLFGAMLPTYLKSLEKEKDIDVLLVGFQCLHECINHCERPVMNNDQMTAIMNMLRAKLIDSEARRVDRANTAADALEFDEDEAQKMEEENDKEDELTTEMAEVLGSMVKNHKEVALRPFSEVLLKDVLEMLRRVESHYRQVAVCIFDDIVEYAQEAALPLFEHFLPVMLEGVGDADSSVRQACVYGLGVCAKPGGTSFGAIVPDVLQKLHAVITHDAAREPEHIYVTENAISSIGKLCLHQSTALNIEEVLQAWLYFLPTLVDEEESKIIYKMLCDFIESHSAIMFGAEYKNLPQILGIFAQILNTNLIDDTIAARIGAIMKQMQESFSAELLQKAVASLPAELQAKLSS